jgi:hypothetical protein
MISKLNDVLDGVKRLFWLKGSYWHLPSVSYKGLKPIIVCLTFASSNYWKGLCSTRCFCKIVSIIEGTSLTRSSKINYLYSDAKTKSSQAWFLIFRDNVAVLRNTPDPFIIDTLYKRYRMQRKSRERFRANRLWLIVNLYNEFYSQAWEEKYAQLPKKTERSVSQERDWNWRLLPYLVLTHTLFSYRCDNLSATPQKHRSHLHLSICTGHFPSCYSSRNSIVTSKPSSTAFSWPTQRTTLPENSNTD